MSDQIRIAELKLGHDIPEAESSVDQALANVSVLIATLLNARIDTGLPPATAQIAVRRLAKAQNALVEASTDVLRAHDELKKIGREYCGWDTEECPPVQATVDSPDLKVVA